MEDASQSLTKFEYPVLIIGSEDVAKKLEAALQSDEVRSNVDRMFYVEHVPVATGAKVIDALDECVDPRYQIIVVDATAAETVDDRVASITQIRERCPSSEIVVLISHQTESRLADLLQAGAWYYLGVPVSKSRLALILLRVVAFRETDKLIRVDGLTGLFNRAFFDDALRDQIARIRESGGGKRTANNPPVSLVLADVDRLEHSFGDNFTAREMFLREIGQILRDTYRVTDVIARIGGDEFAALLVGVSYSLALMRAEIIRKRLSTVKPSDPAIAVPTISVGVVTYPSFFDDARDILARARTALDAAKAAGGNVVFGFDREGTPRPFRELGG